VSDAHRYKQIIQTTFLNMYRHIAMASRHIEKKQCPCSCELDSSKKGGFVRDSEFDLYAKSAESDVKRA